MITRVVLGPEALVSLAGVDEPRGDVLHRRLITALRTHGYLVLGPEEGKGLVDLVRNRSQDLPRGVAQDWNTLIQEFFKDRKRAQVLSAERRSLTKITDRRTLTEALEGLADLVIVDEEHGTALGVDDADEATEPEVSVVRWAQDSRCFREIQDRRDRAVLHHGSARKDFWSDILRPLARTSRGVRISDPYLFNTLWEGRPRTAPEHVVWLIEQLDTDLASGEVTLFGHQNATSSARARTADATLAMIVRLWRPSRAEGVRTLRVVLLPGHGRNRLPHDRHINFGVGAAVKLHAGLDRLREPSIWDEDGCTWQYLANADALGGLRTSEQRALSNSTADIAVWTRGG